MNAEPDGAPLSAARLASSLVEVVDAAMTSGRPSGAPVA